MIFMIDLGVGSRWHRAYLDTDDLVSDAKSRLTRGFTEAECSTYAIDDCLPGS